MFKSLKCDFCGKGDSLLSSPRFPELKICWQCIRKLQIGLVKLLGREFIDSMLEPSFPFTIVKHLVSERYFAIDATSSTTIGYDDVNDSEHSDSSTQLSLDFELDAVEVGCEPESTSSGNHP